MADANGRMLLNLRSLKAPHARFAARTKFARDAAKVCLALTIFVLLSSNSALAETGPMLPQLTDDKPKEQPFKCSAWCSFRELGRGTFKPSPPKLDPKTGKVIIDPKQDESRPISKNWAGFGRRGQWAAIVLEVQNTTEKTEYKGTAKLRLDPFSGESENSANVYQTEYKMEFEVGAQSTKQYTFSILCPENGWGSRNFIVDVIANGVPYQRYLSLHDLDHGEGDDFIVVVSEKPGVFNGLVRARKTISEDERGRECRVASVEPADLPARWHDLMPANLIILDGPGEALSNEQYAALTSYVKAGGHVLISSARDPAWLKPPLQALAGISKVRGVIDITGIELGQPWPPSSMPAELRKEWKLPLIDVEYTTHGDLNKRLGVNKRVEKSTYYYGPGSVTFLPFSLSDPKLENWPERMKIPQNIISSAREQIYVDGNFVSGRERRLFLPSIQQDENAPQRNRFGFNDEPAPNYTASNLQGLRVFLDDSFSKDTPVQLQPRSTVKYFLLFYLLCVVPLNYLLFGFLKRREVAWLIVPAWALAFSVIAWRVGYMGQTGQLTINEVSIVEAGAGQDVGMARTFVGLYAPRRDDYVMEFPSLKKGDEVFDNQAAPTHLVNAQQASSRGIDPVMMSLFDSGSSLMIERLLVQQRSTRRLEVQHRTKIGDGLLAKVRKNNNGGLRIEVSNQTGYTLLNPVLYYEGNVLELGEAKENRHNLNVLLPVDSKAAPIKRDVPISGEPWKEKNAAFFGVAATTFTMMDKPGEDRHHTQNRAGKLAEFVRDQMPRYSRGRAVFCAWIESEKGVLPIRVAQRGDELAEPRSEGVTLLLVPVSVKDESYENEAKPLAVGSAASTKSLDARAPAGQETKKPNDPWPVVNAPVQMKQDTKLALGPGYSPEQTMALVSFLEISLPEKRREMAEDGYTIGLKFKLDAPDLKFVDPKLEAVPGQAPVLNGRIKVEVRTMKPNGAYEWIEIDSHFCNGLSKGAPWILSVNGMQRPVVSLTMDDETILGNGRIYLRVQFAREKDNIKGSVNLTDVKADLQKK